jgi:hypothetical protein
MAHKSARQASARLQFARLAFGAAGSAGASIDLADAEGVTRAPGQLGLLVAEHAAGHALGVGEVDRGARRAGGGPVGAIVNGLEVLEDEDDAGMRDFALDLIRKSARQAPGQLGLLVAEHAAGHALGVGEVDRGARRAGGAEATTSSARSGRS